MNKKILLVGGAGYIGGKTTDVLIENGLNVTVYDSLFYEDRFLKPVNFIFGDVRDTEKLVTASEKFDVIVLMAALVGDPACSINHELTNEINYESIKRFCKKVDKSKHLIFMSTCSVYGAQDGILNEDSDTNPLSSYATTKLNAEKYILDNGGTVFRLGTVFGVGDSYSRIRTDLVVNVLTMKAVKYGKININGGEQWRPIIAVEDISYYILEECNSKNGGLYVLSKENVVIKDLGERVASLIPGTKIEYNEISFQDARNYRVDNSKSLKTFSCRPKVTVEDEVQKISSIIRESRVKNAESSLYNNGQYIKGIL